MFESTFLHRCVLIIDMKIGLQDSDKLLIDMLTDLQKVFLVVLTKADKVRHTQIKSRQDVVIEYLSKAGSYAVPVVHSVSAIGSMASSTNQSETMGYGMYELMSNLVFHLD